MARAKAQPRQEKEFAAAFIPTTEFLTRETFLVPAAIFAATYVDLNIWLVATAAAAGAIMGDNIGYWLGLSFGYPLLRRYGLPIGLSDGRGD